MYTSNYYRHCERFHPERINDGHYNDGMIWIPKLSIDLKANGRRKVEKVTPGHALRVKDQVELQNA